MGWHLRAAEHRLSKNEGFSGGIRITSVHGCAKVRRWRGPAKRLTQKAAFQEALPEIRKWSARTDTVPLAQVQKRFSDCGVRLVFVPCLAKARAAGEPFLRWLGPSAPVIRHFASREDGRPVLVHSVP